VLTRPRLPRAVETDELSRRVGRLAARALRESSVRRALALARRLARAEGPGVPVVVAGSLFLVGEVKGLLEGSGAVGLSIANSAGGTGGLPAPVCRYLSNSSSWKASSNHSPRVSRKNTNHFLRGAARAATFCSAGLRATGGDHSGGGHIGFHSKGKIIMRDYANTNRARLSSLQTSVPDRTRSNRSTL
jgi:hypothetical protein